MRSYVFEFNGTGEVCEGNFSDDFAAQNWVEEILENRGYDVADLTFAEDWDADGQNDDGEQCWRMLVWENEEESQDDSGLNAIGKLTKVEDDEDEDYDEPEELERTDVGSLKDVIVTAGMHGANGQVFGLFATEEDARSNSEESLELGTVGREALTDEQIAMAERNSERLCSE